MIVVLRLITLIVLTEFVVTRLHRNARRDGAYLPGGSGCGEGGRGKFLPSSCSLLHLRNREIGDIFSYISLPTLIAAKSI